MSRTYRRQKGMFPALDDHKGWKKFNSEMERKHSRKVKFYCVTCNAFQRQAVGIVGISEPKCIICNSVHTNLRKVGT